MKKYLKNLLDNKILVGCVCIILVEIIYGISYMFTRKATQSGASSLALLGWRFIVAFIVILLLVIFKVIKLDFKGKMLRYALLTALFSPILYFVGETFGVANTSSSESGVMLAMIPVPAIIASTIILKKKPSIQQIIGIVITFAGVITTVVFASSKPTFSVKGYLFLLLAILSYVMYSVFVEKAKQFSGGELTFCMVASGALVFSISALIESGVKGNTLELLSLPFKNMDFLTAVLYQGICCSAIAFFLQNAGISRIGVNGSSCFIGVSTVVSILAGVLVLHEEFFWYQIVGTILIIAGVITANIRSKKSKNEEEHNMSLPLQIEQKDWFKSKKIVTLSTGIKMAYVEMGNPEGEILILQHGMTDNSRSWSISAPYFAKAGYHVYLPDLVGQGMTGGIDELYTTVTYASNLKAFFDALHIKKAILAGHSLGSMVVQTFALFYPDRVNKIMLLSTLPIKNYLNQRLIYLYNSQIDPLKENEKVSDKFLSYWYDCTIKEEKYQKEFSELIDGLKKESRAIDKKGWRRILLGLVATNLIDLYVYFDTSIPTLVLHGDIDEMTTNEHQPEVCSLLNVKANSYKNYPNVGHNIQFEIPEKASLDMLKWLEKGSL